MRKRRKAKHLKEQRRRKTKQRLLFLTLIVLAIGIMELNTKEKIIDTSTKGTSEANIEEANTDKEIKNEKEKIKETEKEKVKEEKTETKENEQKVDEEIKMLIEKTIAENNLNESNFEFFYHNMDTSKYYLYNENAYFTGASTVKVPIAMLYYDKIYSGKLTKDSKLKYETDCYEAGNGLTSYSYSAGDDVPLSFLLKQVIVNSDNTANNILIKNIGYSECRKEIKSYSNVEVPENFYETNIESASYYKDVLMHLYDNSEKYEELIGNMKQSSEGKYLKKYLKDYEVAHKYGSYNGYVHDYGIVYGESTYVLGIFTKSIPNADEFIANLSLKISNIVNKKQ